jgi:hypothetical protein
MSNFSPLIGIKCAHGLLAGYLVRHLNPHGSDANREI